MIRPYNAAVLKDNAALPVRLVFDVTGPAGGGDVTLSLPDFSGRKLEITDAHLVSKDTTGANVTVKNGSTAITNAIAKGTANNAVVRATSLVTASTKINQNGDLKATISAAAAVKIILDGVLHLR